MEDFDRAYHVRGEIQNARDHIAAEIREERRLDRAIAERIGTKGARKWLQMKNEKRLAFVANVQWDKPRIRFDTLWDRARALTLYAKQPITDYGYCGPDDFESEMKAEAGRRAADLLLVATHCKC